MADTTDSILSTDAPFVTNFARVLADHIKVQYRLRFGDISTEQLRLEVQDVIDGLLPDRITLNTARPDFDNVLVRLMREVEKGDAWKDTTLSSTGQMILRMLAADIDFAQFSIMRALQEAFPHSARNPSSILAAARGHGVRIQRNIPARFQAKFKRGDQLGMYTIPKWTRFTVAEATEVFNREQIHFDVNDLEVIAELHQGAIRDVEVISTGVPLQVIEIGEETYNISDVDLRVIVDGVEWTQSKASIWNAEADEKLYWENMLPNGNVEIRFGDGVWGAAPPPGVTIRILWVETKGSEGNDPRAGLEVRWRELSTGNTILVESITPLLDGFDRLSVNYYRIFSGDRRGADGGNAKRAILRKDFRAHAASYPGVFDAVYRGQAELNPGKRQWMNVIGITLLTDPGFIDRQWDDFVKFMKGGGQYDGLTLDNLEMLRMDPTPVIMNVKATIACRVNADLASVKARLTRNLQIATTPRIGSLGFNFYKSDIYDLLSGLPPTQLFGDLETVEDQIDRRQDLNSLIEYVVLGEPTEDIILNTPLKWIKLGSIDLDVRYSRQRRAGFDGYTPSSIPGLTTDL